MTTPAIAAIGHCYNRQILARYDNIPEIRNFFGQTMRERGLEEEEYHNWMVVFSEGVNNAIEHGSKNNGELCVNISWNFCADTLVLEIEDCGLGVAQSNNMARLSERGYGLTLMKNFCDSVEHLLNPSGGHLLRLKKRYPGKLKDITKAEIKRDEFAGLVEDFYSTLKLPIRIAERLEGLILFLKANTALKSLEVRTTAEYEIRGWEFYKGNPPCERCQSCVPFEKHQCCNLANIGEGQLNCMPISIGHRAIGSIAYVLKDAELLKPSDQKKLEVFAHCVGLAIEENAQIQKKERNLEALSALNIASKLQSRQLQFDTESAKVPGKLYAFEDRYESVAGDVAECLNIDNKGAYFLIADVMGKGVAAAFLGGIFRGGWHLLAQRENHPMVLIRELNRYLNEEVNQQTMFVTAALAYADFENKKLSVINAGHSSLYLQDPNGKLTKLEASGPPLGLFAESKYRMQTIDFKDFSRLYMPTDGAFIWDSEKNHLSEEKLEELFVNTHGDSPKSQWKELMRIRSQTPRQQVDDMSLIIWDKDAR